MSTKAASPVLAKTSGSFSPAPSNLLQRKCACGSKAGISGGCSACAAKKLTGDKPPLIQPKLKISQPNDKYEQEADRVADMVMRMLEPKIQREMNPQEDEDEETIQTKSIGNTITPLVQRQAANQEEDDEETIQTQLVQNCITPLVQRQADNEGEDDEQVQLKPRHSISMIQRQEMGEEEDEEGTIQTKRSSEHTPTVNPEIQSQVEGIRQSGGKPLPKESRTFMESRFGSDFSQVKIHTDTKAAASAQTVNARAYTLGQDIVFGPRQYSPETESGRQLLAHELTHTLQQVKRSSSIQRAFNDPEFQKDRPVPIIPSVLSPRAESGLKKLLGMKLKEIESAVAGIDDTIFLRELAQGAPHLRVSSALERLRMRNISATICRRRNELGESLVCPEAPEPSGKTTQVADDDFEPNAEDQKQIDKAVEQAALTDEDRELLDPGFIDKIESTEKPREFKGVVKSSISKLKGEDRTRHVKAIMEIELAKNDLTIEQWFSGLRPSTTFLGRPIKPSTAKVDGKISEVSGVHKELAEKLNQAEQRIISEYGCTSPKECGDAIGIERIGGVRLPKIADRGSLPSLHVFGLAIDINATDNPRFSGSSNDAVIGRATKLVLGREISLIQKDNNKRSVEEMFNLLDEASKALKIYFGLIQTDEIQKLNDLVSENGEGKSNDDVRKQIELDKENAGKTKVLGGVVAGERNIFNLPQDFVLAMVESGLKWGGNLKNPDVHHFDYRKGTISRR